MKKIIALTLFLLLADRSFAGEKQGSFKITNNNFKDLYNNYQEAKAKNIPWVGSYWAFARNGTTYNGMYSNHRQLGPDQKFDQIFDTKNAATKWEKQNNSCDHLSDPKTKEQCMSWWGHCNAWSGAAIREHEPRESVFVKISDKDTLLTVADQKALLTELYMETGDLFVGERDNKKVGNWIWHKDDPISKEKVNPLDPFSSTNYEAYWDVSPRTFFLTFTNYIGLQRVGLVIDRFTGDQVWNQPVAAYKISELRPEHLLDPEKHHGVKVYPVFVKMRMYWATDNVAEDEVSEKFDYTKIEEENSQHYRSRLLKFYLYFDAPVKLASDGSISKAGKMVGKGTWYHQTKNGRDQYKDKRDETHPDFIWLPTRPNDSGAGPSKPPVMTVARIRKILDNRISLKDYYKNENKKEYQELKRKIAKLEADPEEKAKHLAILKANAQATWSDTIPD